LITHRWKILSEPEVTPIDTRGHTVNQDGVLVEGDRERRTRRVSTDGREL
jgi:hypothetical protein